jgi:hypothetical protein
MVPLNLLTSSRAETTIAFELLNQLVLPFFIRFTTLWQGKINYFFSLLLYLGYCFGCFNK